MPEVDIKPPDGDFGWVVVFGSALAHFFVVSLARQFGLFYTPLKDKFQSSAAATAWTVSICNTVRMSLGPVASMLSERFTCRAVVIVGGIITATGCVLSAMAPSLHIMYLTFGLITGIGGSLVYSPSYVIVQKYFDKKKGKAMSFATLGAGLGSVILSPILSLCLEEYGYFGAMLILGGLMLNNCVAGALYRPLPRTYHQVEIEGNDRELETITQTKSTELHYKTSDLGSQVLIETDIPNFPSNLNKKQGCCSKMRIYLRKNFAVMYNLRFLLYIFQVSSMAICIQSTLTFLPDTGTFRGVSKQMTAILLSIIGGCDIAGRFVTGFIFDIKKLRHRRRMLHSIIGVIFGGLTLFFGFCQTFLHFVLLCVLWGFMEGGYHSQRATVVSEFTRKEEQASAIGFTIAAQGIGNLVGPPIAGLLRDVSGDYIYTYIFIGMPHVIMTSLFLLDYFYNVFRSKKLQQSTTDRSTANL